MWERLPIVTAATVTEMIAKTRGLPDVETTRLVRDERGWLRLGRSGKSQDGRPDPV